MLAAVPAVNAQSALGLSAEDLPTLQSDDISDAQLQMFVERAEQEGISINNAFQMAVARGLRQSVASQLRNRIQTLSMRPSDSAGRNEGMESTSPSELESVFIRPEREESEEMRRTFGSQIFRHKIYLHHSLIYLGRETNWQYRFGEIKPTLIDQ